MKEQKGPQGQGQGQGKEANGEAQKNEQVLGSGVSELPYDMTVAGEPEDTVFDDLANAFKPKLR